MSAEQELRDDLAAMGAHERANYQATVAAVGRLLEPIPPTVHMTPGSTTCEAEAYRAWLISGDSDE